MIDLCDFYETVPHYVEAICQTRGIDACVVGYHHYEGPRAEPFVMGVKGHYKEVVKVDISCNQEKKRDIMKTVLASVAAYSCNCISYERILQQDDSPTFLDGFAATADGQDFIVLIYGIPERVSRA